ncbi:capsid cement protein [Nonomuraea sp. NPDC050383]|uniref:capsid cement protein n=1 Tax=Nonomuraea sp. NPDC050383 TaxID=3364362 RepID=UPI0037B1C66D
MTDYTPIFSRGLLPFTATTSATVTGGQFVSVSGNGTVAPAAADAVNVVGVAAHDAASGTPLTVHPLVGVVHEMVAGTGGITAGQTVKVGAAANAVLPIGAGTYDLRVGIALTTAAQTAKVQVLGR